MIRALVLLGALLALGGGAVAQQRPGAGWTEVKCSRYAATWPEALARFGRDGLGAEFLARHDAFLASGCRQRAAVCPRSAQEIALADAMTVAAMNAGTASSFLPFACSD